MKARLMFLASLLVLTGCNTSESSFAPGDEVSETNFNKAFAVREILLNSNYHVDVTFNEYDIPSEEGHASYSKSIDFDGKKAKVLYTSNEDPFYFDFSRTTEEDKYSFDFYSPYTYDSELYYSVEPYDNVTISNGLYGIKDMIKILGNKDLTLITGITYSDFKFNNGIYELKESIQTEMGTAKATFNVIKVSFKGNVPKEVYYHMSVDYTFEAQVFTISMDSHLAFSKHGEVKVELPEIKEIGE